MSKINGRLVTCDRCGKSEFTKVTGEKETDGGFTRWSTFEPLWDWGYVENKDLCPDCFKKWTKIKEDFLNAEKAFFEEV